MLYYQVNNDLSKVQGIDGNFKQFIMDHLYELINNNKAWVIVISLLVYWDWQTHDKIYQ